MKKKNDFAILHKRCDERQKIDVNWRMAIKQNLIPFNL
jgi:hypothetical protein